MRSGNRWPCARRPLLALAFLWATGIWSSGCHAIDNPDAPDHVADFEARARQYEVAINERAKTSDEIASAYAGYERFLDKELNSAYSDLLKKLNESSRRGLMNSQRRWLQYRDAEFAFIETNWTPENFGSSYRITRGGSRARVVRSRVVELLGYLKNY